MKTAVSTYSLIRAVRDGRMDVYGVIDFLADLGVTGVEFLCLSRYPGLEEADPLATARKLKKHVEKHKLKVAGYTIPAEFLHFDEDDYRREIDRVKREVDIAAELGARVMRHDVTRGFPDDYQGKATFAAALKWLVPACQEVADYARKKRITTCTENHGFFAQHSTRIKKLVEAVDRKNYGTLVDIGNFNVIAENSVTAVRRVAPYAKFVHVKDFHLKKKTADPGKGFGQGPKGNYFRGSIVGHGDVDVQACLRILKESGYRGWYSIEFEGMEPCETGVTIGFENMVRYLGKSKRVKE